MHPVLVKFGRSLLQETCKHPPNQDMLRTESTKILQP